ncbi:MAG TPA: hypothetical protein VF954_00025 [Acidimicrobiales bacterium]
MSDSLGNARERRVGLRTAMGEVEASLASPATGRKGPWLRAVREDMQTLSAALELHISTTEAPGGLLDDIAATAPDLADRVKQTRLDHERLGYRLHEALQAISAPEVDVADVRARVVELLAAIVHHRHEGADLVYEAFDVDIDSAD